MIEKTYVFGNNYQQHSKDAAQNSVVILIDGANLFYAAMHLKIEIDYIKLLRYLVKERQLLRAYFYTAIDNNNEKQRGFLSWMHHHGYRVITKELILFADGSKKANVEVEMAVDMMTLARYCNTIVLISGNGDLAYAVNHIAYQGVQVELVSLASMTSDKLIDVVDSYTDIQMIQQDIANPKKFGY
jgi:uncharacterized LabA/DUF88 family protein